MCGIVGVVGDLTTKEEKAFNIMLQLDVIRGKHSTGVIRVNSKLETDYVKAAVLPQELMDMKAYDKLLRSKNVALIGHNRAATVGKVNSANAHPFEQGNIIGVHNGTLSNAKSLERCDYFDTDSENLYYLIDKYGLKDAIGKIRGAYALAYVDTKNNTVNLIRNPERPLAFAYTKDGSTMLFASERWMIEVACAKAGVELAEAPVSLNVRTLLEMKLDGKGIKEYEVYKDHVEELPAYTYTPPAYLGGGRNRIKSHYEKQQDEVRGLQNKVVDLKIRGWHSNPHDATKSYISFTIEGSKNDVEARMFTDPYAKGNEKYRTHIGREFHAKINGVNYYNGVNAKVDSTTIKEGHQKPQKKADVVPFKQDEDDVQFYCGYDNKLLTPKEFKQAVRHGCAWCGNPHDMADDDMVFISNDEFVCGDCVGQEEVKTYLQEA